MSATRIAAELLQAGATEFSPKPGIPMKENVAAKLPAQKRSK